MDNESPEPPAIVDPHRGENVLHSADVEEGEHLEGPQVDRPL